MRNRKLGFFTALAAVFVSFGVAVPISRAAEEGSLLPALGSEDGAGGMSSDYALAGEPIPDLRTDDVDGAVIRLPAPLLDEGSARFAEDPDGVFSHFAATAEDTVHYRVCKDLSICELSFGAPPPGIVTPGPSASPVALAPLVPAAPPVTVAAAPGFPWWLLAVPAAGLVFTGQHDHGESGTEVTPPPPGGPPVVPSAVPPSRPPTSPPETPPRTPPTPPAPAPSPPPGPPSPPPPDTVVTPPDTVVTPPDTVVTPIGPAGTVTPEPASMILLGSGLLGLAWFRKRRR